jgi:rhodanese-related sulfurtransferase
MSAPIVENVSIEEVKKGLADGSIALIDVREQNEWDDGHIAGAILNPLSTFDPDALPRDPAIFRAP